MRFEFFFLFNIVKTNMHMGFEISVEKSVRSSHEVRDNFDPVTTKAPLQWGF